MQAEALSKRTEVVTIEDHLQDGGFGSWLLEARASDPTLGCVVYPIALRAEVCGTVGSQKTLHCIGGI
jgi:transketolase